MNINLEMAILDPGPGWTIFLDQLGAPYRRLADPLNIRPRDCGLLIVNRPLAAAELRAVEQFLHNGGAVLDSGPVCEGLLGTPVCKKYARTLYPELESEKIKSIDLIDLFSSVYTLQNAPELGGIWHQTRVGRGVLGFLGMDFDRLFLDSRRRRKAFANYPQGRFPHELVSAVSRGTLYRLGRRIIMDLFFQRGLPFLQKWYYPGQAPSIFAFRVDSDYAGRAEIDRLYEAARDHQVRMTWFLHVEAHRSWLSHFHTLQDQEIAAHGYYHYTFRDVRHNLDNLRLSKELLEEAGFSPAGFCAPFGLWNPALAVAEEQAGFEYASEFSLAYDHLPFYPFLEGRFSPLLQVPVHPVSIGSLDNAGLGEPQMDRYFQERALQKLAGQEPLIFYDHPGHRHLAVLENLFRLVKREGIPNYTFGEYARWWRRRSEAGFSARFKAGGLTIALKGWSEDQALAVYRDPREMAFLAGPGDFKVAELNWRRLPERPCSPGVRALRRFQLRRLYHGFLFHYRRLRGRPGAILKKRS